MREPIYPQTALQFFNKLLFYLYKIDIVTWKLRRSHEDNVELRTLVGNNQKGTTLGRR